jgi:hypothetical protein
LGWILLGKTNPIIEENSFDEVLRFRHYADFDWNQVGMDCGNGLIVESVK